MENLLETAKLPFDTLTALFQYAPLGLGVCDQDFKPLYANEALRRIEGIWASPAQLVFDERVLASFRGVPRLGRGAINQQLDGIGERPGPLRSWAIQFFPLGEGEPGQASGMLWREITPRPLNGHAGHGPPENPVALQDAIDMAVQAATHSTAERVRKAAHDLRTPLHAMLGWLHLLESGKVAPEEHLRTIQRIKNNARTQEQLIGNLRDIVEGKAADVI